MPAASHATVAARRTVQGWRAVMLTGAPDVGKSDLLLRLIADGWRLVADDYAEIFASGGHAYARAPETIAGRMEVRGQGVVPGPSIPLARLVLAVACDGPAPERLPDPDKLAVAGVYLPRIRLRPLEASAAARIDVAFRRFRSPSD